MSKPRYPDSLIAEVMDHYGVGPLFTKVFLDSWIVLEEFDVVNLADILELPDPWPTWFEFVMTSNQRGQNVLRRLQEHLPSTARKHLDVGCGYGGFPIAFAESGMQVTGIDIDEQLLTFAEANCADHGLQDCVHQANILESNLEERFGTFDVITCFDVIEHVLDAELALKNMVSLLKPGGLLALEIPNKNCIQYVAKDGHFSFFGITLLDRPDAKEYHQTFYEFPYGMGEYYELGFYKERLAALSCEVNLLAPHHTYPFDSAYFRKELLPCYVNYRENVKGKLPPALQRKIQISLYKYLARLGRDYFIRRDRQVGNWFDAKYRVDFWRVLAKNHAGG